MTSHVSRKTIRIVSLSAVALVVVFLAVRALWFSGGEAEDSAPAAGAKGRSAGTLDVRVFVVSPQRWVDSLNVSGSLRPDEETALCFEAAGKLTHIYFKEGAQVSAGQLLAKVNDAPLQAEKQKLEARIKLLSDRRRRTARLLEMDAVSREALQEAEADIAVLRADIDLINARIAQTELRAPFAGVIGLRAVSLGAYVTTTTPIATLTRHAPLKVEFNLPERYAGLLATGSAVRFTADGDQQERTAEVYATDSRVQESTRTYSVRARYANADGALLPGRYVSVHINAHTVENAISVPSEALVSEMGRDKVFLYRAGKAESREVVKGMRSAERVQIVSGLAAGDSVITSGTMQLREGGKVRLYGSAPKGQKKANGKHPATK